MRNLRIIVGVAAAVALSIAVTERSAQATQNPSAASEGARINMYIDVSSSIRDTAGFNGHVMSLVAGLPALVLDFGAGRHRIEVVTWGSNATDIWSRGRAYALEVPALLTTERRPVRSETDLLNESGYRRRLQRFRSDSVLAEQARMLALAEAFKTTERAIQRQVAAARIAAASRVGGCTSIAALGARLRESQGATISLVLTDGRHTCEEPLVTPDELRSPVAVLLCPSGNESSREFMQRVEVVRRLLPQASVTPGELDWAAIHNRCRTVGHSRMNALAGDSRARTARPRKAERFRHRRRLMKWKVKFRKDGAAPRAYRREGVDP